MKNHFLKIKFLGACVLIFLSASAQQTQLSANEKFEQNFIPSANPDWIKARPESNIQPQDFFSQFREPIGLNTHDEMRFVKENTDELGILHQRFQQYHKGYKVYGGEFILHSQNNRLLTANGKLMRNYDGTTAINFTEDKALEKAEAIFPSQKFLWKNDKMEQLIKESKSDPSATYFPKGELVWMWTEYKTDFSSQYFVLCYSFDIYSEDDVPKKVFVNAETGEVVTGIALGEMSCDPGSGTSIWNGTISLNSHKYSNTNYVMWDDCAAPNLIVRNAQGNNGIGSWVDYSDADNIWTSSTEQPVVQTYYGELVAYDYWDVTFARWSFDNAGQNIVAYNNILISNSSNNACFNCYGTNELAFGNGNGANNDHYDAIDIVGHELTHGVTAYTTGLVYQYEPGALDESFSDIFGEMTEKFAQGSCDWLVGGQLASGNIRSFSNPNSKSQPDTYGGTYWVSASGCTANSGDDYCGVHTNSGVQNYWYYLLCNGGSGTNDNGTVYSVTGIGTPAAAWITYYGYVNYLTSQSNYIDARQATIEQANYGYGNCSTASISVGDAWYAVGVGNNLASYNWTVCGNYPDLFNYQTAANQLTAAGTCNVNINPSSTLVSFTSAHDVYLKEGFIAYEGCNFDAYVDPCGIDGLIKLGAPSMMVQPNPSEELGEDEFKLTASPNPAEDLINLAINAREDVDATIEVLNLEGQAQNKLQVRKHILAGENKQLLDVSSLPQGMYFIRVASDKQMKTIRVVKM